MNAFEFLKQNFDWEDADAVIDKAISEFLTPGENNGN